MGELACECGTFAIGRCVDCGVAVCGTHSTLVESQRVCDDHATKRRIALTAAEQESALRRNRVADYDANLDAIAAIEDAIQRLLMVARVLTSVFTSHQGPRSQHPVLDRAADPPEALPPGWSPREARMGQLLDAAMARVCPELRPAMAPVREEPFRRGPDFIGDWGGSWDSHAVGRWIAVRLSEAGRPKNHYSETRGLEPRSRLRLGKQREIVLATHTGWCFHKGFPSLALLDGGEPGLCLNCGTDHEFFYRRPFTMIDLAHLAKLDHLRLRVP